MKKKASNDTRVGTAGKEYDLCTPDRARVTATSKIVIVEGSMQRGARPHLQGT